MAIMATGGDGGGTGSLHAGRARIERRAARDQLTERAARRDRAAGRQSPPAPAVTAPLYLDGSAADRRATTDASSKIVTADKVMESSIRKKRNSISRECFGNI